MRKITIELSKVNLIVNADENVDVDVDEIISSLEMTLPSSINADVVDFEVMEYDITDCR